jgi:formamidopyrimidine-DNA glycosylase
VPELPEVETVVRGLRETIVGKTIKRVRLNAPPASIVVSPSFKKQKFERVLAGRSIMSVDRRGKNILIRLSGDVTLWAHLKMTGHFFYLPENEAVDKHDLALFDFSNPESRANGKKSEKLHLRFNDYRRFGRLRVYNDSELWQQKGLAELGPEPLEISADEFVNLLKNTRRMIKPALLDQSFIVGVGNIYADESLYAAKVHPKKITSTIARPKLVELHGHLQRILKYSIKHMGTSVDSYSGVNGQRGSFQKYLKAYGREGEQCINCSSTIVRETIGSRSAHYCPRCQREPR